MEIVSTTKTYALGQDNVTYFETTTTVYDDESKDAITRRVGPANQLAADQADKIKANMAALAASAQTVSKAKTALNEAGDVDTTITNLTGVSPLKKLQDAYLSELTTAGWTIDEGAGFVPLVFSVNAQGVLKYSVNGAATKNAVMYGAVIRLKNYPASPTDTEFYLADSGNRYFSLPNRGVVIKKP